jgi:hypothetical protein
MTSKPAGELSKIVLLALGVLVATGSAQKSAVCTPPTPSCTTNCGSSAKKQCVLQVIESTGLFPAAEIVILDDNGQPVGKPNDDLCVEGTPNPLTVVFQEGMSDSSFVVSFGSPHPFALPAGGNPVFQGNDQLQPRATVAPNTTGIDRCYQYEINHCRRGHKCAHKDPKVIVKGGVLYQDGAKKPEK